MAGLSPALPLTITAEDGPYRLNKTILALTRQNLKTLILTCPGERIMDPDFGVGIRNFLFSQNTQFVRDEIGSKIVEQADIYMDYIEINNILFGDGDPTVPQFETNLLTISIKFTILPLNVTDILSLPI